MPIIPIIRCSRLGASLDFYTRVLDFECALPPESGDPAFAVLTRGADRLFLSSHHGDGVFGQPVVVTTTDIDALHRRLLGRGLRTPGGPDSPVEESPVDQTWGTREFYVRDPDGNTIRFTQPSRGHADRAGRSHGP